MFYSLWYNAPKLLPAGSLGREGTDYVFGMKDVAPGHRPATTWVHYTTRCKIQSCAPEDGQKIARNMLSRLEYQ